MLVTVIFGKQSTSLSIPAQEPDALDVLKTHICERFHLEKKFQRLVLRGRDVKSSTPLTDGCKLLLLRNRAYYEQEKPYEQEQSTAALETEPSLSSAAKSQFKPPSKAFVVDVNDLDDNLLLVRVFRGKVHYDLIFPASETILEVKKKVCAVLGLNSPQSLRLVIKGKTPQDDAVLDTLTGDKKLVKVMVLLQAQHHLMHEKEEELRELLNELVCAQTALQSVQRQMLHNHESRDESFFKLSRILDEGQRIRDNLDLLKQHLAGAKTSGPHVSSETLAAVTQAINATSTLTEVAQHLLETHSSF